MILRVVLIIAAVIAVALVLRMMRSRRRRWLDRLRLTGAWSCERDGVTYQLDLTGGSNGGSFEERWIDQSLTHRRSGRWHLRGANIAFESGGQVVECELRSFGDGSIGIHGPGMENRIYRRRDSNVVPIKR